MEDITAGLECPAMLVYFVLTAPTTEDGNTFFTLCCTAKYNTFYTSHTIELYVKEAKRRWVYLLQAGIFLVCFEFFSNLISTMAKYFGKDLEHLRLNMFI